MFANVCLVSLFLFTQLVLSFWPLSLSLPLSVDVCRTAVLDLTILTYAPVVCFFSNRTFRNYSAASSMLKKALTLEVAFIEALRWERVLISKTVYNSPNM